MGIEIGMSMDWTVIMELSYGMGQGVAHLGFQFLNVCFNNSFKNN